MHNTFWWQQTLFRKLFSGFLVMMAMMTITGLFGLYFTDRVGEWGAKAGLQTSPIHDAIMEMQLRVVEAHLAVEEILAGNKNLQFEANVFLKFQEALEIAHVVLQGGRNGTVEVPAVSDPEIRQKVEHFREKILILAQHAREMYEAYRVSAGTGSSADSRYDEVYHRLQEKLKEIQSLGMRGRTVSLLDRIADIRYLVADNHLYLEELLADDPDNHNNYNQFMQAIRDVDGQFAQMTELREEDSRTLKELIKDLKDISRERYELFKTRKDRMALAGQWLNASYHEFSKESKEVELILEHSVVESMTALKHGVNQSQETMLLILMAGMAGGLVLAWLLANGMARPIMHMTATVDEIAASGDFSKRLEVRGRDELARLAMTFNQMAANTQAQKWLQEQSATVASLVQQAKSHGELCQSVVSHLVEALSVITAAFLVMKESSGQFQVLGSHGLAGHEILDHAFGRDEGLVGQCSRDNRMIQLHEAPPDYLKVRSTLGEGLPGHVLVVPVALKGEVLGVLELASFHPFAANALALIDIILPTLALGLEGLNRLEQTRELLEEAQRQAEELELQQEELRQNNESLHIQTQKLEESESELRSQQEELRSANEELELQTANLELNRENLEKAHRELAEKAANLEQASRYKSEFLANMSHELRTPLNSLLILSKLFAQNEQGNLTQDQLESAKIMHESGHDLLALINDILDLAKIEAGRVDLRLDDLVVPSFVEKLEKQFKPMAAAKELTLQVVVEPGSPQQFRTDPQKLEQIIRNLLSNAIKFTDHGGVSLTLFIPKAGALLANTRVPEQALVIKVRDTGIGIPADKQHMIFEAFQQVDGSTSRMFGGTGLGLSISQELARLLGGEIVLESTMGEGSTFYLILPLAMQEKREQKQIVLPEPIMPRPTPLPAITEPLPVLDDRDSITIKDPVVLVIEDDTNFFSIISRIAHKKGYKCLNATNGAAGLEMVQRYHLIGVVLDPGLPDIDGLEVLKQIKENPHTRHVPVHVISAREFGNEILTSGAIGALHKPVSVEQINEVCKRFEAISGQRARQVLLAEDDPVSAMATSSLIQRKNAQVTVANRASEVLDLLRKQHFDCLILDLGLPDMNGFDLLDRLVDENLPAVPPVIVYSGKDLTKEEHQKLRESTAGIVVKGVESADRLMEEVSLFFHSVEQTLPVTQRSQTPWVGSDDETLMKGKTVLVVDDDMRNTFALKRFLALKGMQVMVAANGQKALETLANHSHKINLVLMDIMMPVMDGYEAILHIRKQERLKHIPIIVLSAKAMLEDRVRCLEAGANDFLPKPVDVERLYSLLRVWFYA